MIRRTKVVQCDYCGAWGGLVDAQGDARLKARQEGFRQVSIPVKHQWGKYKDACQDCEQRIRKEHARIQKEGLRARGR